MARRDKEGRQSLQIREALSHVGELMRLPTRRPSAPAGSEEAGGAAAPRPESKPFVLPSIGGGRIWLPVVAASLAAVFAIVKFWPSTPPVVPETIRGEWATNHPKYVNNRIAFTDRQVVITNASGASTAYPIEAMTVIPHRDSTRYTFSYKEGSDLTEMRAVYVTKPKPRLVFARPEGLIWEQAGR